MLFKKRREIPAAAERQIFNRELRGKCIEYGTLAIIIASAACFYLYGALWAIVSIPCLMVVIYVIYRIMRYPNKVTFVE